jgi:hypothetical protein
MSEPDAGNVNANKRTANPPRSLFWLIVFAVIVGSALALLGRKLASVPAGRPTRYFPFGTISPNYY